MAITSVRTARPASLYPSTHSTHRTSLRTLSIAVWTAQALLAAIFLFAGSMKLLMSADLLAAQSPLPILLVRFIGVCETAGALGMILPGLLRIAPGLTSLAAAGLVVLMLCATILTPILITPDPVMMLVPATVGILAACVGYARLRLVPLYGRV